MSPWSAPLSPGFEHTLQAMRNQLDSWQIAPGMAAPPFWRLLLSVLPPWRDYPGTL